MVILAGDHIYKMDYELMLAAARRPGRRRHRRLPRGAAHGGRRASASCTSTRRTRSPPSSRSPPTRPASPASPTWRSPPWASTSSAPSFLADLLRRDAETPGSSRDFGKDLIPYIVKHGKAVAHRFGASCVRSTEESVAYWRDVGTVDAYWEANIDLTDIIPELDLYDTTWPIWTYAEIKPPAKFVHDVDGRRGSAVSSLVAGDCIISGASHPPLADLHRRAGALLRRRSTRR